MESISGIWTIQQLKRSTVYKIHYSITLSLVSRVITTLKSETIIIQAGGSRCVGRSRAGPGRNPTLF